MKIPTFEEYKLNEGDLGDFRKTKKQSDEKKMSSFKNSLKELAKDFGVVIIEANYKILSDEEKNTYDFKINTVPSPKGNTGTLTTFYN